eukprot:241894_1
MRSPRQTSERALFVICVLLAIIMSIVILHCIKKLLSSNTHRISDKYIFVQAVKKGQKKRRIQKKDVQISFGPCIRFGTILSLICCFITSCGYLSTMFMITRIDKMEELLLFNAYPIILQIKSFTWHLGRILVNFVFVQRLHSSFKDTPWAYSNRVFVCLHLMLFCLLCLTLIETVIRVFYIYDQSTDLRAQILVISHLSFVVLDIISILLLTVIFHKKVFQLIGAYYVLYTNSIPNEQKMKTLDLGDIHLDDMRTDETSLSVPTKSLKSLKSLSISISGENSSNVQANEAIKSMGFYNHISDSRAYDDDLYDKFFKRKSERKEITKHLRYGHTEKALIHSMVQHTTLVSISVITSMVILTNGIAVHIAWFKDHQHLPTITAAFYGDVLVVIECVINSLCLYLQFPFAFKLYRSLCCADKVCLGCVAKCVEKSNGN